MRVLLVHSSADMYGSDKSALELASRLVDDGQRVTVLVPEDGPLCEKLRMAGVDVISSLAAMKVDRSVAKMNWGKLVQLFSSVRVCRGLAGTVPRPDVIHSNTAGVVGGVLLSRILGVPHIWTVREIVQTPRLAHTLIRLFLRFGSDTITFNSRATAEFWSSDKKIQSKSRVISNAVAPIDSSNITADQVRKKYERLKNDEAEWRIGIAGRVNEWKGHRFLLQAIGALEADYARRLRIYIAGDTVPGAEDVLLQLESDVVALDLVAQVEFLGFVQDIGDFYRSMDMTVVPSILAEPYGRVAAESIACGTPVIAAAHGGLVEVVEPGFNGYLCEPGNVLQWSATMQACINDPAQVEMMAKNCLTEASSIERMVEQYLQTYKDSVSSCSRREVGKHDA